MFAKIMIKGILHKELKGSNMSLVAFSPEALKVVEEELESLKLGKPFPRHVDLYNWLCIRFNRKDLLYISTYPLVQTFADGDSCECIDLDNKIPI